MLTMLRSALCFCPEPAGARDIVIAGDKIFKITAPGAIRDTALFEAVLDCRGLYAFPGFIDQHIHITGAGGEQGFESRVRALEAEEIAGAGVTTAVGLLGADGVTRGLEALYAKAKGLEAGGLTTYIYSGSYAVPPVTLMGSLTKDLVFIDKVLGAGEIAISDHRSSNPDARKLTALASQVHLAGLLSGKAGVVHLHVGDGKGGLSVLRQVLRDSDLPAEMFVPTHVNRNPALFREAVAYCRDGGRIDLTAGEKAGLTVPDAVRRLLEAGINLSRVTVSSDAGGSAPDGGVGEMRALYEDFVEIINKSVLPPERAVRLFTENPAAVLKLPQKGALREGGDADILLTDAEYTLRMLFAMGRMLLDRTSRG
jgi:beta-aspartyl-dipeptidase (metallo-type)